jgi:hypothetical protein
VHAARGATAILEGLIERIRSVSSASLRLRADAGFAVPRLYRMLEKANVEYTIGLISNDRLRTYADRAMDKAKRRYARTKAPVQLFGAVRHRALSWSRSRRVVYKAEYLPAGENRRFVVTNSTQSPREVYSFYRGRGDMENRIKDLKNALMADRLSCHRFVANAFRFLIHALAYVLMDHLRRHIRGLETLQFDTIRLRLIKIGALVRTSVRRVLVHLPTAYPWKTEWTRTARLLAIPISS